jgi:formylglycine-generating enzyme required for sulfatase activity
VGLAAVVLAVLVAQVALAGGSDKGPRATASAVSAKKFKKLKKQVAALQAQVDALARQPGPQGPQGPAGTASACAGNGSGDTMVAAGAVCIDKYEVSVWSSPTGGTQYGASSDNYPCDDNGQDCTNIYARSVAGVTPSGFITYFQAQQALANVGKRLPSNAEWQQAVAGTPDPDASPGAEDCWTSAAGPFEPVPTGSRDSCISSWGANDMVGKLWEWVGDWVPASTDCPGWGAFSDDSMCLSGASTTATNPGALIRSGSFNDGVTAGPFAVVGDNSPASSEMHIGFRGAR